MWIFEGGIDKEYSQGKPYNRRGLDRTPSYLYSIGCIGISTENQGLT